MLFVLFNWISFKCRSKWSSHPELSSSLRALRSFRALLFVPAEDFPSRVGEELLASSGDGGVLLAPSLAIHLLFSFAPPELKSPHESAGWSVSR